MEKSCKSCIYNDDGLCDKKGYLIEDDDTCEQQTEATRWREAFLRTFLAGH